MRFLLSLTLQGLSFTASGLEKWVNFKSSILIKPLRTESSAFKQNISLRLYTY